MKISKENLIHLLVYALIAINAVAHFMQIGTIALLSTAVIIGVSLFLKKDKFLVLLYICLPFFKMLNAELNTTSAFYVLVLIFVAKYYLSKDEKYKVKTKTIIIISLLFILILNMSVLEKCITWYISLLPLILTYKEKMLKENIGKIIFYFSLSTALASGYGYLLLENGLYPFTDSYVWNAGQIYTRFGGMVGDSNIYSQCILLLISFNLIQIEKYHVHPRRYILVGILAIFTVLTYSKMNIFMLAIIMVAYIIYKLARYINKKNAGRLLLIILIAILGFFAITTYIKNNTDNTVISSYITRFSAKDLLTGRTDVYDHYIELWKENPTVLLWGIGFEKYMMPYSISSGMTIIYSHNIYIETISLFGGIIFTFLLGMIIVKVIQFLRKKRNVLVLAPIAILFITGFVLHGNLEFSYYYNIIITIQLFINEMYKEERIE